MTNAAGQQLGLIQSKPDFKKKYLKSVMVNVRSDYTGDDPMVMTGELKVGGIAQNRCSSRKVFKLLYTYLYILLLSHCCMLGCMLGLICLREWSFVF